MARKDKEKRTDPNKYDIWFYERKVSKGWNNDQDKCDRGNFKGTKNKTRIRKWSCDYNNCTANKAVEVDDGGRMAEIFSFGFIDSSWWAVGQVDNRNDYYSFMFYPMMSSMTGADSGKVWTEQRPRYANYPAILNMESLGFLDVLMYCKKDKYKNNLPTFSEPFKPFVVQQSQYAGRMLARKDDYYLDATALAIYNKKTGQELNLNSLDESIFFPFQSFHNWAGHAGHYNSGKYNDYLKNTERGKWYSEQSAKTGQSIENLWTPWIDPYKRQDILRKWCAYKYFGSQLKTEHYIPNEEKYNNYINSLVGEGEKIISVEPININTTPKEDYIRYILEHVLGTDYYDYNDDLIFTINKVKYIIDWDLTEYRQYDDYQIVDTILLSALKYLTMEKFEDVVKKTYGSRQDTVVRNIMSRVVDGSFDFRKVGWALRYSYNDNIKNLYDLYTAIRDSDDYTMPSDYSFVLDYLRIITNVNNIGVTSRDSLFNVYRWYIYLYSKKKYLTQDKDKLDTIANKPILFSPNVLSTVTGRHYDVTKTWQKTYIPDNELANYKYDYEVLEDEGGKYIYKDISTKLDTPEKNEEYIIEKEDGTIEYVTRYEEYSSTPLKEVESHSFKHLVKFSLPETELTLDRRPRKYIDQFKNNQISGYFVKYYDKDGNTRIKIHSVDGITFQRATCDVTTIFLDMMPLVPHFSQMEVVNPLWVTSNILKLPFGALACGSASRMFYYIYDKKVNAYFNSTFKWPIKQWDRYINGEYEDKEYKVKLPRKVSRRITNEKALAYMPPTLNNAENDEERARKLRSNDMESYEGFYGQTYRGLYGAHISFRFSFAIFFSKLVRRTKTLNKAAIEYLEFYWSNFGGRYDIPFSTYVYPSDRIQYIEKRLQLYFIKRKLSDLEAESLGGRYFSKFEYDLGRITFFNKTKKVKYELDMNKLYPNWKWRFFSNKVYFKTSFAYKYNYLTITLDDISPLIYTDSMGGLKDDEKPLDVYKLENGKYKVTVKSYYYDTPVVVRYKTKSGVKEREFNLWNRYSNEYCCFYTPYDETSINKYKYQDEAITNFTPRNIAYYLYNIFSKMSNEEIRIYYSEIFGVEKEEIVIHASINNPFDFNGIFSTGLFRDDLKEPDWKSLTEETITQKKHTLPLSVSTTVKDPNTNEDVTTTTYNLDLMQSYELYKNYSSDRLLNTLSAGFTPKSTYIWQIIDYLFISDLPAKKILSLAEFKHYFIDYDRNGILAKIFTEVEMYNMGFTNYLVSNDDGDLNEPSVILAKILQTISRLIGNSSYAGITDVSAKFNFRYDEDSDTYYFINGYVEPDSTDSYSYFDIESYWLPLPIKAYNKFPFYAKMFCTTYFSSFEMYHVQSLPTWNKEIARKNGIYEFAIGVLSLGWAVIAAVLAIVTLGPLGIVAAVIIIIGVVFKLIGLTLELVGIFLGGVRNSAARTISEIGAGVSLFGSILIIIGSILLIIAGAIEGGSEVGSGAISATTSTISGITSGINIAAIVFNIISLILNVLSYAFGVKYNNLILDEYERLNNKIDEYNASVDKVWKFIEENEGRAELGLLSPASLILTANLDAANDPYQAVYNYYEEEPLTSLYTNLNSYYEDRTI